MARLPKIRLLRDNMRALGWCITAFNFGYNHCDYIVLFEDAKVLGHKEELVIAVLTFIDVENEKRKHTVCANTGGFDGPSAFEIMDFFMIKHSPSLKGFFQGFYDHFNESMPEKYVEPVNQHIRELTVRQLGIRDNNDNPDAVYCYDARHNGKVNGKQKERTPFNTDKTKLLRQPLFERLGKDTTISFFYSPREEDYRTDLQILDAVAKRNGPII